MKSTVRNSFSYIAFCEKRKRLRRDRTMRENDSRNGEREVAIEYTEKPVSGWGGMVPMFRYFDRLGVREYLEQGLPDGRTLPNQVDVVHMTMQLMASIL